MQRLVFFAFFALISLALLFERSIMHLEWTLRSLYTTNVAMDMGICIGPIQLDNPVILAPMSGVTDMPFRRLVQRLGVGMVVSEEQIANNVTSLDPVTATYPASCIISGDTTIN